MGECARRGGVDHFRQRAGRHWPAEQVSLGEVASLLGEEVEPGVPRFQVYEPGCPMLAKYLPKMRWDEKNPRKMADHKFDHWIVCLAYFAISSGVLSITQQETSAQRPAWMDWVDEAQGRRRRA